MCHAAESRGGGGRCSDSRGDHEPLPRIASIAELGERRDNADGTVPRSLVGGPRVVRPGRHWYTMRRPASANRPSTSVSLAEPIQALLRAVPRPGS